MRTSGLFTTHTYEIKLKSCNDDIFIVPFSDIHFGADGFCGDTWKEFAAWGGAHPNAWYIGNGDYIDCFRSSMQKHIKDKLDVEELKYIDRPADEMLDGSAVSWTSWRIASSVWGMVITDGGSRMDVMRHRYCVTTWG